MALARVALEVSPEQIAAGDVWVATAAGGSVAGIVALGSSEQPNTLDLDKLFVEPQRIRTGVGRALIAHAIGEARRRGAQRLTILSDPYAAGFYERTGARLIGEAPSDAIPGRSLPFYEIELGDDALRRTGVGFNMTTSYLYVQINSAEAANAAQH